MRALQLSDLSGPDGLELVEVANLARSDAMALIEVHAAGVGFVDLLLSRGAYQVRPELPFVPGIEVAGVVRDADPAGELAPGQRVAAIVAFGGFAELALAPELLVCPLPDSMSLSEGAAFMVNYQTAHLALTRRGRLRAGETVLVHGAGGGVGSATVQLAHALGARVFAVAGGEAKRDAARSSGADELLDPAGDWVRSVLELTGGRGVDIIFDPVGGERFEHSLRCLAPEGRLLVVGFASGAIPSVPANKLLLRHLEVIGVNFGGMLPFVPDLARRAASELLELARGGQLRPLVGSRWALGDGAQALRELEARRSVGKPVLVLGDD